MASSLLIHLCRTLRWGYLLSGMQRVPFRPLNEASGIGFMMLLVLPFRLGEFARPFLIAQRSSIRRSAAMTSVVLERITDGLLVATMLRVLLFFLPTETDRCGYVKLGSTLMFAVFGGGLAFLLFARWQHDRAVHLVRATVGRVVPRLADKMADIVDSFVGAMGQLPDAKRLARFFLLSFAYWGAQRRGHGDAVPGLRLLGRGGGHVPAHEPGAVPGLRGDGRAGGGADDPRSAPGMMGTFQAATYVGLEPVHARRRGERPAGWRTPTCCGCARRCSRWGLASSSCRSAHLSFRDIATKLDKEGEASAPVA